MIYEVTIGIPVYNVERYIRVTLDSALAQTFDRIEFLVLDDCGTDDSMNIVRECQQTHPRGSDIRIVRQPQNMGVSAARNRIIDEAKGCFLYFMDSDDTIEPNTIALLMEHQKRIGADIVFGSYDKIETYNGNRVAEIKQYQQMELLEEDGLATFANSHYGMLQTNIWNFCIDVQMLRQSGVRFIDVNYWEDMAFMFELVTYCKRAVILSDITYHYLCRYDSLSNYQQRDSISKDEVLRRLEVADYMKRQCAKLKQKHYYPARCYNAVMTSFYIACYVLKSRKKISPSFTAAEIKSMVKHPAAIRDILRFSSMRWQNLLLYMLGKLPARLGGCAIYAMGRLRRLI